MDEERERERKQEIVEVQRCLWWMFEVNVGFGRECAVDSCDIKRKTGFYCKFYYKSFCFIIFCEATRIFIG